MDLAIGLISLILGLVPENREDRYAMSTWSAALSVVLTASFAAVTFPSSGKVSLGLAVICCLFLFWPIIVRSQRSRKIRLRPHYPAVTQGRQSPLLWAFLLVIWLMLRDAMTGRMSLTALSGFLVSLALIFSLSIVRSRARRPISQAEVTRIFLLIIGLAMIYAYIHGGQWLPCRPGKCNSIGELYRGIFQSENTIGLFAAMGVAFAVGANRLRWKSPRIATLIIVILMSGSRTALAAIAMGVLVSAALSVLSSESNSTRRLSPSLSYIASFSITAVGIYIIISSSTASLSGRGRIWQDARQAMGGMGSLTGIGVSEWPRLEKLGLLPEHFPHSIYLHLAFGGGLIALALFTLMVGSLIAERSGTSRARLTGTLCPAVTFALLGITEVIWNPATIDFNIALLLSLLVVSRSAAPYESPRGQIEHGAEGAPSRV